MTARAWFWGCLLGLLAGGIAARAASLPEWARPSLTPETLAWKKKEPLVTVLDDTVLEYLRPDAVRSTERIAVVVNQPDDSDAKSQVIFAYNQDTERITTLKLWHHTPGGKTRVLDRKLLSDMASHPSQYFWNAYRVLRLSQPADIKAGDVLLWEIACEGAAHPIRTESWSAGGSPLYHGRFTVIPAAGTKLVWYSPHPLLQNPALDAATGRQIWTLREYAPLSGGKPTHFYPIPVRVALTCFPAHIPFGNWEEAASTIAKVIEPQIVPSPSLVAQAQKATAGKTARWERIRALVDLIQAEVSYLSMAESRDVLDGYRPQTAEQCFQNRYGDCKDKATLLAALLRAIGDQGHVLLLYAGNPTYVNPERALSLFNHAITAIPADDDTPAGWPVAVHPRLGRFVIVDATTSGHPLGTLPQGDQSGYGLLVMSRGGDLIKLPEDQPGGQQGTQAQIALTVTAKGSGQARLEEDYRGQDAAELRALRLRQKNQNLHPAVEKRLAEAFATRLENVRLQEVSGTEPNHTRLTVDFVAPNCASPAGTDLLVLKLPLPNQPALLAPWRTARPGRSWLPLTDFDTTLVIKLEPGLTLAEPIPEFDQRARGARATLRAEVMGDELRIHTTYVQPAGLLDQGDYEAIRTLGHKYLQAVKRPVLLRMPASPRT